MGRMVHKEIDGVKLTGFSVAGEESVIAVPEYNTCFDIGRAPREVIPIDNVCLSHGHMDHAAGIAYYFSQRAFIGNSPGRIIVDRDLAQPIQKLMDIWGDIEGHPSPGQVYGVTHLEDVPIRRGLVVRAFRVNHAGGALGFTLIEQRRKLKAEFHGKTGPQLVALKAEGIEIEETIEQPVVTYSGDTAPGRFLDLDFVRNSRVVLLECTFFEREHRVRARAGRHVHVDDLPEMLSALSTGRIVLTHLSRRTDLRSAKQTLERILSASDFERVSFLMERPPRRPRPADRDESADTTSSSASAS